MKRYQVITLFIFACALVVSVKLNERIYRHVSHIIKYWYHDYPTSNGHLAPSSPTGKTHADDTKAKSDPDNSTAPNFTLFRMFHY